jgi:hypothetical protein
MIVKLEKVSGILFINSTITVQLEGGPEVLAECQVIVCKNKNDEWTFSDVEPIDIDSIKMMGVEITELKAKQAAIEHFKNMVINLWEVISKEMLALLDEYTVSDFVKEMMGIEL